MTTVRTYKVFLYGSMAGLIALGVLLGALFPNLPAWAFLGMAVVGGGAIFSISKGIERKSDAAISDERVERNTRKAADISYRVTYPLTLLTAMVILNFFSSPELVAAGRALLVVGIFQAIFFTATYFVIDRKDR